MAKISPGSGILWLQQGWALFQQQPAQLLTLGLANLFLLVLVGNIPLLGRFLSLILTPVCSMSIMVACHKITRKEKLEPDVLLAGFRSPAMRTLLKLGMVYAAANWLAIASSSLVDHGTFMHLLENKGKIDQQKMPDIGPGMITTLLVYLPFSMAIWFAGPLIMWKNMSLSKALFYSFFAFWRAILALIVFIIFWFMVCMFLLSSVSVLLALLTRSQGLALIVFFPLLLTLGVVLYCAFYPSYIQIFGTPGQEPVNPPPPSDQPAQQ